VAVGGCLAVTSGGLQCCLCRGLSSTAGRAALCAVNVGFGAPAECLTSGLQQAYAAVTGLNKLVLSGGSAFLGCGGSAQWSYARALSCQPSGGRVFFSKGDAVGGLGSGDYGADVRVACKRFTAMVVAGSLQDWFCCLCRIGFVVQEYRQASSRCSAASGTCSGILVESPCLVVVQVRFKSRQVPGLHHRNSALICARTTCCLAISYNSFASRLISCLVDSSAFDQ
jgi:hypothetical protein